MDPSSVITQVSASNAEHLTTQNDTSSTVPSAANEAAASNAQLPPIQKGKTFKKLVKTIDSKLFSAGHIWNVELTISFTDILTRNVDFAALDPMSPALGHGRTYHDIRYFNIRQIEHSGQMMPKVNFFPQRTLTYVPLTYCQQICCFESFI